MTAAEAPPRVADRAADEAAIRDVIHRVMSTWEAGDADAFAGIYTENATLVGDAFMTDREHIRAFMAAGFAGPYVGTRLRIEPLTIRFVGDEVAWLVTEGEVLVGDETAAPDDRHFLATALVVKRAGEWRMAAYQNAKGKSA